jgi:hypothetical protein
MCTCLAGQWKHQPIPALPEEPRRFGGSLERLTCPAGLFGCDPYSDHVGFKASISGEPSSLVLVVNLLVKFYIAECLDHCLRTRFLIRQATAKLCEIRRFLWNSVPIELEQP